MLLVKQVRGRFLNKGERTQGVISGSALMAISSIISTLTRVGLISILARVYSRDQFGLWVTITSATAIMATSDFGIGNALRNKLSELRAKNDDASDGEAREYFLSVVYFFMLITVVISLCLVLFHDYLPYYKFFKTDNLELRAEGVNIILAVQILFLLSIPLGIGSTMFFAYLESIWVAVFNILNGLVTIIVIGLLALLGKSITIAAILFFLINFLVSVLGTLYFLYRRNWSFLQVDPRRIITRVWSLLAVSITFAILQFAGVFMYNAATLVVTAKISLTDAAEFNLVQKLYTFIIAVYLSLYNPLWAGYSDAIYRNDWKWSKRTLVRTMLATILLFLLALFAFSLFGNFFLKLLAGQSYTSQILLFVVMGIWALSYSLYSMGVAFISATGKIKAITGLTAFCALFFVSIAVYFSEKWGLIGLSVWSALAFLMLSGAAYYQAFYIIRKAERNSVASKIL